jgi:hypothetical protein
MSAKNNILLFFILVVAMLVMPFDKGDPVIQCLANSFSSCCFIYIYIQPFNMLLGLMMWWGGMSPLVGGGAT